MQQGQCGPHSGSTASRAGAPRVRSAAAALPQRAQRMRRSRWPRPRRWPSAGGPPRPGPPQCWPPAPASSHSWCAACGPRRRCPPPRRRWPALPQCRRRSWVPGPAPCQPGRSRRRARARACSTRAWWACAAGSRGARGTGQMGGWCWADELGPWPRNWHGEPCRQGHSDDSSSQAGISPQPPTSPRPPPPLPPGSGWPAGWAPRRMPRRCRGRGRPPCCRSAPAGCRA